MAEFSVPKEALEYALKRSPLRLGNMRNGTG